MQSKTNRASLLIMDDAPGIQKILTNFLQKDFDLVIKNDGMEGMNWLDEGNTADLILADLNMPNLSGKEFLRTLRSSNYYKNIPVVILSAENESNERIACLNMGADDFIEKPFNPVEVLTKINVILRRTRNTL
jgi:DNA-binding response OmpR family regulator